MFCITKMVHFFWGEMSKDELKRFWILSATFFVLIGAYWFTRSMKDAVFANMVGYRFQPFAKMVSLFCVIGVVLFYNKLLDLLKKNVLFYLISLVFGIGFIGLGYLILFPDIVSAPAGSMLGNMFSFIPGKFLGWFIYCFIESFGSIMPALFLSIVVSTMSTESAKKGYGMIYAFGQVGLILGTWFIANFVKTLGFGILFIIGGALVCTLPILLGWYVKDYPIIELESVGSGNQKPKTGMFEGLKLLLSRPYVAGLFVISATYEVIGTIVEFQMGLCATTIYPVNIDGGAAFAWLKAMNGLTLGILSLSFALMGTSFLMRKFGLKFCIISYPALIGITIATIFAFYMAGAGLYFLMWAFFVAVVIFKALSYTFNNPAREVLYVPTSRDVKFKSKSWSEAFGNRTTKGAGAIVTGSLGSSLPMLLVFGTFISLGIVAFWIFVAAYVGNKFDQLQKENKIIE